MSVVRAHACQPISEEGFNVEKSGDSVGKPALQFLTLEEQQIFHRVMQRKASPSNGFAFTTHAAEDILRLLKTNNELRSNLLKQNKRLADLEVEVQHFRQGGAL